jgi:ribokinase
MTTRIAVAGSLMMDIVVRAPRLPVPGESLLSHSVRTFPGGKGGNQAVATARLGATVAMIGRVGDDDFGRALRSALEADSVDTTHVTVDSALGTGVAVPVVLDSGENAIFAIPQANFAVSAADVEAARATIEAADTLLLQFEIGMDAVVAAAGIAAAAGVRVILNPAPIAPHPLELLELATVIVANEVEAAALAPEAAGDHAAEVRALRNHAPAAIVTLGEGGCIAEFGDGVITSPAFRVTAVDSVGAGDAFCAGLAVALGRNLEPAEALRFANAVGALAVTRAGAQSTLPTLAEVEALLARRRG